MAKKTNQTAMATTGRGGKQKLSRKERKRQKKALRKEQLELEKQLVNEGKIPARNKYHAKSFFGRAVALCLTFLFGIVATVGAFLGFGAFAPARDVFWLMGLDYQKFVSEEYGSKGLLDLVSDVLGDINSSSLNSLGSLAKYTPIIDGYADQIVDSLSPLGVDVDKTTLKNTAFKDLGTYLRDEVVNNVVLGEALGVTPSDSNRMMVAICYGNKGVDYTVDAEGKIVPITPPVTLGQLTSDSQSVIDRVCVEDAFGVTAESNAAMRFLAYGTEGFNYRVNGAGEVEMLRNELTGELFPKKTLADITSDSSTPLDTAKISDLIDVSSATGILAAIKDWTTDDLKQGYRIERLRIDQVMTIGDDASAIAKAIKNWRLCDITDSQKMDTLKLGDIIKIDETSPPILKALKDTQIGELADAVDGLRLSDVLNESDIAGNNFLKSLKLSPLTSLGADLKKLSAREVFGEEMYAYREIKPENDKSVYELYKDYAETGKGDKDKSADIPKAHTFTAAEEVRSYFEANKAPGTKLQRGFYKSVEGGREVVAEKDVHTRKTTPVPEGPEVVTYYTTGEQKLTPFYDWRYIDYEGEEHIKELPEEDRISSDPAATNGRTVPYAAGEHYLDGEGNPYYYLTTRIKFAGGAPTEETEQVAYPVMQDENGIYYTYIKYTPGGGAAEFSEMRVDLEREIVLYTYGEGEGTVNLTKNAAGKWSYMSGGEEPTEVVVNVYTHAAETNPETGEVTVPAYDYIKTKIEVLEGYYEAPAEGTTITGDVYGESDVEEKFEIVTLVEGEVSGDPVPVERYLSGVWFFLFGGEGEGCFTDKSDMPVLDLTDAMGGMSDTLSNTVLWQLYFHGLLTQNPFVDLKGKYPDGITLNEEGEPKTVTNLNECTVSETIILVEQLLNGASGA